MSHHKNVSFSLDLKPQANTKRNATLFYYDAKRNVPFYHKNDSNIYIMRTFKQKLKGGNRKQARGNGDVLYLHRYQINCATVLYLNSYHRLAFIYYYPRC